MDSTRQAVKLIFYSSRADNHQKEIALSIPAMISKDQICHCCTINEFSTMIRKMVLGYSIILLLIRNRTELDEFLKLENLLQGQSIILILQNTKNEMMRQGLKLYPRYTTYIKSEYSDIFLVLEKMTIKIQNRLKGEKNGRGNRDH